MHNDSKYSRAQVASQMIINIFLLCSVSALIGVNVYSYLILSNFDTKLGVEKRLENLPSSEVQSSKLNPLMAATGSALRVKRHTDMHNSSSHHHWSQKIDALTEKIDSLSRFVEWKPAHAQLALIGRGPPIGKYKYGEFNTTLSDDLTTLTHLRNNYNIHNTHLIPDGGLYHVYGQVTWEGRDLEHIPNLHSSNKYVQIEIVALPQNRTGSDKILVSSQLTQYKLGGKMDFTLPSRYPEDHPSDSNYVAGYAHLRKDQILSMRFRDSTTNITYDKDKSFLGYYQLQRCPTP